MEASLVTHHPEDMEDQLAYLIASVNRQLEEQLQESLRPEGVPLEQFRILSALASSDGRPMGELASMVLVDAASLTKIVDRMIVEALVYRAVAPEDRRRVLIFLAAKGKALHKRLKGVLGDQQRSLVDRLDLSKAKQLTRILRGLMRE
jgi:DNA-binding MarR family transcriptional regulator